MPDVTVPPGATITARPCTRQEARELAILPGTWVVEIERDGETSVYPVHDLVITVTEPRKEIRDSRR